MPDDQDQNTHKKINTLVETNIYNMDSNEKQQICNKETEQIDQQKEQQEQQEEAEMDKFFLKFQHKKDDNRYFSDDTDKICHRCNQKGHLSYSCLKNVMVDNNW